MRITVHKDKLQRALGFVERVTAKNATLPILNNILFQTAIGQLKISATNLEVGVTTTVGAKIDSEGRIAVPGRVFLDFIRSTPNDVVSLELKQNTLHVHIGKYQTTILCFDASEYPILPKIEGGSLYTLSAQTLRRLIDGVGDSIALSDSRPELAGALLCFESGKTTMAATDVFRLAEQKEKTTNTANGTVIIPRGVVLELSRILSDISGDIAIRISDNQISFSHDEFEVVSRLIDGKYPDYRKVIPEKAVTKVLVQKSELENAAKVAALFSSSISDILICGSKNEIVIKGKNANKGEAQASVAANMNGDDFEVSMNYHYFLDGLKAIPTEKIILEYTGKGSPFVLRPNSEEKDSVYLIMPLRS